MKSTNSFPPRTVQIIPATKTDRTAPNSGKIPSESLPNLFDTSTPSGTTPAGTPLCATRPGTTPAGTAHSDTTFPRPFRVAAYCRVSTEDESQSTSYASQIAYYTQYIGAHPGWICAGIFADEGLSGTQTRNRREFNRLMRQCKQRKIDIILCKSISRFARNTVDCLTCIRELKTLGIAVIFEKENLNTLSLPSEFFISLHASFAQAESESISRNITWGIEKSFREGRFPFHFKCMMGYQYNELGQPEIIEDEANVIREIFHLFISGQSAGQIAIHMTDRQVLRRCGSTQWSRKNVEKILKNEKYAGFAILQKSYTVDCLTHERAKNTGERPMYYVENCLPPIIDKETFHLAQAEFERRSMEWREKCGRRKYLEEERQVLCSRPTYALNQLLCCPYCGSHYHRVIWKSKERRYAVWRCAARLERGSRFCPNSISIHETDLQNTLTTFINARYPHLSIQPEDLDLCIFRIEVWDKTRLHIWFLDGSDCVLEGL